eukprot:346804-Pelagomonas_calceolata.AAC.3
MLCCVLEHSSQEAHSSWVLHLAQHVRHLVLQQRAGALAEHLAQHTDRLCATLIAQREQRGVALRGSMAQHESAGRKTCSMQRRKMGKEEPGRPEAWPTTLQTPTSSVSGVLPA